MTMQASVMTSDVRDPSMRHGILMRSARERYDRALAVAARKPFSGEAQSELLAASKWMRTFQEEAHA